MDVVDQGFSMSQNPYDWLGDGVYFFQDAPHRAREWATQRYGGDGVVIRSIIRLDDCIDLLDFQSNDLIVRAYQLFTVRMGLARRTLPRQTAGAHRLDRAVMNYAVEMLSQDGVAVRVVRGVFAEGVPVFPGSAIMNRAHVQIAVRDASLIESAEIVTGEGR
jgi:hypothetical protein